MKSKSNLKLISAAIGAAVAGSAMLLPVATHAADSKPMAAEKSAAPGTHPHRMVFSDRENYKPWSNDKDTLKAALKTGQNKAFYAKTLADNGYQITSINSDKADYVEYEVVKGRHSYEVQVDFDKSGMASKVDIDGNLWRADSTKAAMRGNKYEPASFVAGNERFSDRSRMKGWQDDKEKLEKQLAVGQDKNSYASQLKKLGYQITSINDNEKDYLEYEVVKGSNSYEVQIDLEAGKGKKIDVTSNMWQSEATEKALSQSAKLDKK